MRLQDSINQGPAAVAFGLGRGGATAFRVSRDADSVSLVPDRGGAAEFPAATQAEAGMLSAADKAKLDGLSGGPASVVPAQFESRARVAATHIAAAVTCLRTAGFAGPGDGGDGLYIRAEQEPAHPGKVQSADGAWWELVPEARGWNALALGLTGDYDAATNTGTDNAALLQACLDTLPKTGGTAWEGGNAMFDNIGRIFFPSRQFYFGSGIEAKHRVHLLGTAVGNPASVARDGGTLFVFAADTLGITLNASWTLGGGLEEPATTGADGSVIEGILLMSLGGTDEGAHGVWFRAKATVRHCLVQGFPGNGIEVRATASSSEPALKGNANLSLIEHTTLYGNRHGLHFEGWDANACQVSHCNAMSNRGWGFIDESLIGNFFYGCHAASNGEDQIVEYPAASGQFWVAHPDATEAAYVATEPGSNDDVWYPLDGTIGGRPVWSAGQPEGTYRSGGSYASTGASCETKFLGCYVEDGQGIVFLAQRSLFTGLNVAAQIVGGAALIPNRDMLISRTPIQVQGKASTGDNVETTVGDPVNFRVLAWTYKDASGATVGGDWRLQHDWIHKGWWFTESGSASRVPLSFTGPDTLWPEPYRAAMEKLILGNHVRSATLQSGSYTSATGAVAPSSGTWRRGEVIFACAPLAGDAIGTVCTTTGTAGSTAVFRKFGAIDA